MTTITVQRVLDAKPEIVFDAITNIDNFTKKDEAVVNIRMITEQKRGVGTRFVETRRMGKREMDTELEITEWTENESVRMVADSNGTIWDTLFSVSRVGDKSELKIHMEARTDRIFLKIMNKLMSGFYRRGMKTHLNELAEYVEQQT